MAVVEAKYIPSSEGSCEVNCLLKLHSDMHGKDASQVLRKCNNQSILGYIKIRIIIAYVQHIDASYHHCRDFPAVLVIDYFEVHQN
jgi:hypothetical protein